MEVIFNRLALADLARIRAYIGAFNPMAAERMAGRLIQTTATLAANPMMGRAIARGRRELAIVPPYVMIYRIEVAA